MQVTHIIAPGPLAGAENVVVQGCDALRREGHAVKLVVLSERRCPEHAATFADAARVRGLSVELVEVRGRLDPSALWSLRRRVASVSPQLVHAHGYKALAYAILAKPIGAALVVTHHGETGHDRSVRAYEAFARWLYRRVDAVFSVSSNTSESLISIGVPRDRVRTVANPVSFAAPNPDAVPRSREGALLFVGRLSEEKGVEVLLKALGSELTPPHFTLDIAGDGPCAESWKALSTTLGLDGRVRWLGMRSDVPDLLAQAEALVLPSHREGLPLVVLEAAASEVPVVASRVGGIPETVWEGETAMLVAPGDVEAWVEALCALPSKMAALRAGAHRRGAEIRDRHSPKQWARLTAAHYDELVRDRASP